MSLSYTTSAVHVARDGCGSLGDVCS